MADEFYVTVEGTKQGKFKAESQHERQGDRIAGVSFQYGVASPRDAASGQISGKRVHRPVAFVKRWGASTPQFFQALCTNEVLKSVYFEFVKADIDTGEEYVYHTIKLLNASVTDIDQSVAGDAKTLSLEADELERISLIFQRIELENKDGKTMAVDDWFTR